MTKGKSIHDTAREIEKRYNELPQWRRDWVERDTRERRNQDLWKKESKCNEPSENKVKTT